jgi:hypothetical protein
MTTGNDRDVPTVELRPFHLAIAVGDLAAAESYHCGLLGSYRDECASSPALAAPSGIVVTSLKIHDLGGNA